MDLGRSKSKLSWSLSLVATGAMVLSVSAQEAGQTITFSTPQSHDAQELAPSLVSRNSDLPVLPGTLLAPIRAFSSGASIGDEQPLPPVFSSRQQRSNPSSADRPNWTLMTPEEILGVANTEQGLQTPERDAFGREKKKTPMERYLDRENQARLGANSATNDWGNDRADSPWKLSRDDGNTSSFGRRLDATADPVQNLARFLDIQQNRNGRGNQNGNSDGKTFDAFARKKAADDKLEQQATMQRFREMLQPGSGPSADSQYFAKPAPVVNPNYTVPDFVPNPVGASFKPLSSSIGRPTGLTPLPDAFTTRPQSVEVPSWKPQPPPWVSQSGTPTAFPQQKF
jgi:hypothetical protein